MKRYLAPLGALLLIIMSIASLATAQGRMRETEFYNFQNGMSPIAGFRANYCGQHDENGVIYLSPGGFTVVEPVLADATCDGRDGATEATQDLGWTANAAFRPIYMHCLTNATLGAGETIVFQLRIDGADVPGMRCSLAVAGLVCDAKVAGRHKLPKGGQSAVQVTQVSDNADDDSKCIVIYAID